MDDYPYKSGWSRGFTKREALLEAQNHRCAYCGIRLGPGLPSGAKMTVLLDNAATIDEIIPRFHGGAPHWFNQVMACWLCNTYRGCIDAWVYFDVVQKFGRYGALTVGRMALSTMTKARNRTRKRRLKRQRARERASAATGQGTIA